MNPRGDSELARRIEAFRSNIQLLLHNKFTEGIPLSDIIPMYYRFFALTISPADIVTEEKRSELTGDFLADWATALSGCSPLRPYLKLNRDKTRLLSKKETMRSESEMLSIAKLANFSSLNAVGYHQLIKLVIFKFKNLPVMEQLAFKTEIGNLRVNSDTDQISNFAPNGPVTPAEGPFFSTMVNFPVPLSRPPLTNGGSFDPSNTISGLSSDAILDTIINDNGQGRNDNGGIPTHSQGTAQSSGQSQQIRKKRRPSSQGLDINGDHPKKWRPSVPKHSALTQTSETAVVNGDIFTNSEPEGNLSTSAENVNTSVIEDTRMNAPDLPETTVIHPRENGIIDSSERNDLANSVVNVVESFISPPESHSRPASSNQIDVFSHRPLSDLEKHICDNMANLKEFSQESDGRLNPNHWMIFLISKDELGHYKGREKLNCQAKYFCLESKSWKLHATKQRKLRIPNKMVVYGEFVLDDGETCFEIIDCLQCDDNIDLLNSPFNERYKKAQEMILQLINCTVEGIPVRMKPYLTIDNLAQLSGQTESENANGTALLIHSDIYAVMNPRTLLFNSHASLKKLLKEEVFLSPGAIETDFDDNINEQNVPNSVPGLDLSPVENNEVTPVQIDTVVVNNADIPNEENINENAENVAGSSRIETANVENDKDSPLSQHNNATVDIQTFAAFYANAFNSANIIVPPAMRNVKSPSVNHSQKNCTVKCADVDMQSFRLILSNPFAFCIYYGWERMLAGNNITYIAPCGKVFDTYKKVMDFLIRTDFSFRTAPHLTIDYFTFEHEIRENVEFPVWNFTVINENITNDLEKVPITCVNEIDKEVLPEFDYIIKSTTGNNVQFPLFDIGNECICTDDCQSNCCSCVTDTTKRHTKGFVSSVCKGKYKGYDFRRLYRSVPRGIYECNYKCKCSTNSGVYCGNRVIQNPIKWKLQVFRKPDGWGLRTLHDIPKGHFVCQFIGKIVLEAEAADGNYNYQVKLGPVYDCPYKNCSHQLGNETLNKNCKSPVRNTRARHICLNVFEDQAMYIDATHEGNVGRFINHAPKSNVFMQTVFIEELPECRPHIGFFAKENILAGREITANFSAVRSGINETISGNEKEKESLSQRPGPKRRTGKGDQDVRNNNSVQTLQSQVPNSQSNGAFDVDMWNFPNLGHFSVEDDVLSQGSSRSSTSYSTSSFPVVRLEKINIDQALRTHKLTRSQNSPPAAEEEKTTPVFILPQIKTEPVQQEISTTSQIPTEPMDVSNVKQEIVKIEVCDVKLEKTENEDELPQEFINEESQILGLLNLDDDSEMMVDNPQVLVSTPELAANDEEWGHVNDTPVVEIRTEVISKDPVVEKNQQEIIDLTEDSDDNPSSQEDVVVLTSVNVKTENEDISEHFQRGSSIQENSQENSQEEIARAPLDFSRSQQDKPTGRNSPPSQPSSSRLMIRKTVTKSRKPSRKSLLQSHPSTSRDLIPTSRFSSEHTVEECMRICCTHNNSGLPECVANNKLFRCRVYGFERKVESGSVFYETPCGKMFVDEQSIFEFLLEGKHRKLSIDNFCFNPEVECSPVVWMQEQCFDLNQNTVTISEDITNGKELIPIRCRSTDLSLEFPQLPTFRYIAQYEFTEQYKRESIFLPENCCCSCKDGCLDPGKCVCMKRTTFLNELHSSQSSSEKLGMRHGYCFRKLIKPDINGIFECGSMCQCFDNCSNRVVQNDSAWSLEVFNTPSTGWGVRTLQDIPQGAFVCNFVGQFKLAAEAESGDKQYQVKVVLPNSAPYTTNAGPPQNRFVIDATREGNLARFINHSCSPNMFSQIVFVAHSDVKVVPYVSFFANQDIVATTELTFDYTGLIEDQNNSMIACYCGASNCKERFLYPKTSL